MKLPTKIYITEPLILFDNEETQFTYFYIGPAIVRVNLTPTIFKGKRPDFRRNNNVKITFPHEIRGFRGSDFDRPILTKTLLFAGSIFDKFVEDGLIIENS